jgi:hypothetical protein
MANSLKNKYEYLNEASIDRKLICIICNKPLKDPRCFSCGHVFCRECVTQCIEKNHASCPSCQQSTSIDDFSEVDDLMRKQLDSLLVKCLQCGQITLPRRDIHDHIVKACSAIDTHSLSSNIICLKNEQQDQLQQSSAVLLFEPLRSILSELIIQNRDGKERMNQLEKQTQQQYQTLIEQSKKNEELRSEIVQLKEQIIANKTHISKLEADNQTQQTAILQFDQHHNLFEATVKSLTNQMKYKSSECVIIFS